MCIVSPVLNKMYQINILMVFILVTVKFTNCVLLFPRDTIMQLSWCLVVPLELPFENPNFAFGRIAVNQGFQINYNMPYTLTEFYKPTFWALRTFNRNFFQILDKYLPENHRNSNNNNSNAISNTVSGRDKRDLSAGQLYLSIENKLETEGFSRECLRKSICELAKDPLHRFDANGNEFERDLFLDIIHFVLTPSAHDAFDISELEERTFYEEAELIGRNDGDCNKFYAECKISPLEIVTHKIEEID